MTHSSISSEQKTGFEALRLKFLSEEPALLRLLAMDSHFRELCDDYGSALQASEAWKCRVEVAHQFRCIAVEIEMEVEELLGQEQTFTERQRSSRQGSRRTNLSHSVR